MSQEQCLLLAFGPERDGVGECSHGLPVTADKRTTKVNAFAIVLFRMEKS